MAIKIEKNKKTMQKIQPFDYGTINDRDKQIVEEVIKTLDLKDNLQVKQLKEKFKIEDCVEVPFEKSIFYVTCKEQNIFIGYQGSIREGNLKYPIFSICADCRELDKLVLTIAKKYKKL